MKQAIYSKISKIFTSVFRLSERKRQTEEIIVSLTSYPPRIDNLQPVLETIFNQTKKPDKIILWLATTEFPNKEADLPDYLINLVQQNKICIEWCNNLKPHKKYFYALQKYRDSIVITIDDDLLFDLDMIECLLESYKKFPRAISVMRSHIMHPEGEKFADYACFTQRQNEVIGIPSMRLLATNGAGSLFPPRLLDLKYFDEQLINELCLCTDDLWLKAIEVLSGVPVVQTRFCKKLKAVENSQEFALSYENTLHGGNDRNLENIRKWVDAKFGKSYFMNKIFYDFPRHKALIRQKLFPGKTILYFAPHQDDELLTMGIDICSTIAKGNDVHVILCTDGSKSRVRLSLDDHQNCSWHQGTHDYKLSEDDFMRARDLEFVSSCRMLGVPQENIHILSNRAVDGKLDVAFAEKIIKQSLRKYGRKSTVATIHFDTGEKQHRDHRNLGLAAYNLWKKGNIKKVRFLREPYCVAGNGVKFICRSATPETALRVRYATYSYGYWNPDVGRYAIGYHSVSIYFENLRREMKMYYCKMKN